MKKMKTFRNLALVAFMLVTFGLSAQNWTLSNTNIYNNNTGFVGIGNVAVPSNLLHVSRNMIGPQVIIQNLGGTGGAGFTMIDNLSGANWKFKAISSGGFKIRDHASALDVIVIEKNSAANAIYIESNGIVGFGTNTPGDLHNFGTKVDVRGDILMRDANAFLMIENTLAGSNCGVAFSEEGTFTSWIYYDGFSDHLIINADPGGGWRQDIVVHSSGDVGIGTATTKTGYKLSVAGNIACEEVLVENSTNWPDYVFDEGYELMSLEQLEESIETNNHLPGMPSATEVEEKGFSLGEMQKVFLEKLEELTLYTIEQGKQINAQQKKIEALEQENNKLRK